MSEAQYFGVIAVVGRPNVGKSSLMNRLLGEKVSIVSRRPQTTWREITGIDTSENVQLVFIDSPGMHKPKRQLLSKRANQSARGAGTGADILCMVTDCRYWTSDDQRVLEHFRKTQTPIWLLLNKVDLLASIDKVLPKIESVQGTHDWAQIIPVSAKTEYNCKHLLNTLRASAPLGSAGYDAESLTTMPVSFLAAELVREQIFRQMGDEIPYVTGVEISRFEEVDSDRVEIDVSIWCDTTGQKAALIGAKGARLKNIGTAARRGLEKLLAKSVSLNQMVKVKKGWSDDSRSVTRLGYSD